MQDRNGIDLEDRRSRLLASLDSYRADAARAEIEHEQARVARDTLAMFVWGKAWHELNASIVRVEEKIADLEVAGR